MSKSSDLSFTKEFDTVSVEKSRGAILLLRFLLVLIFLSFSVVSFIGGAYFFKHNNSKINDVTQVVASVESVPSEYKNVSDSVVKVIVYNSNANSESTGAIISDDGYIVCCDHIFSGIASPNIMVEFNDLSRCNAAYIGGDNRLDISVIKVEKKELKPIQFSSAQSINVGQAVYAVGYNGAGDYQSVTQGVISAINQRVVLNATQYPVDIIQFDAPVSPGNSGSPLVNENGEMVAMVTSKYNLDSFDGIGYAIDAIKIKDNINEIIEYGCVQNYVKLGISVEYVGVADALMQNTHQGMRLQSVSPQSDLYGMGIEVGDIITSINGIKINHLSVFYDQLEATKAGAEVELVIIKADSTERSIPVRTFSEKGENSYMF